MTSTGSHRDDMNRRQFIDGGGQAELVRATCLYVATKLGDIMDELVVVGGLVPSLFVNQQMLPTRGGLSCWDHRCG